VGPGRLKNILEMQTIESLPDKSMLRIADSGLRPGPVLTLKRADLRDLNFIGWAVFLCVVFIAFNQAMRETERRDFVYFYAIGHLLNHYSPARLYDFALQRNIVDTMMPSAPAVGQMGPFAYPPHLAMLFQPFAVLPYWTAFRLWMAISTALYLSGLYLLIKRFCGGDLLTDSLFLLFGVSFWPFINWILLGGQLSAIGFAAMALAIYWEDSGSHFLSGLALSVCTYKPTLLVLILPMLVVTRRAKTLTGFGAGALTFIVATAVAGGWQVWIDYVAASSNYAGISHVLPVRLDVRALAGAIPDAWRVVWLLLICASGVAGAYLAVAWWRARNDRPVTLMWATTITWTLVLNLYVPVYDSVQVIISLIATAAILTRLAPRLFYAFCLLLLISSYISSWFSSMASWQLLTPVLTAIAILQLAACFGETSRIRLPEGAPRLDHVNSETG
jgi:hypothetical protein